MTRLYGEPLPGYGRDPLAEASPDFPPWQGPRHSQARPAWRRLLPWLLPVALAAAIAGVVLRGHPGRDCPIGGHCCQRQGMPGFPGPGCQSTDDYP